MWRFYIYFGGNMKKEIKKSTVKKTEKKNLKRENVQESIGNIVVDAKVTKDTALKKSSVFNKFSNFVSDPRILGTFIVGLIIGLVIMRLCFPERIAKLADGKEVVLSYGEAKITADDLYEDMKDYFSVNVLLNDVDMG